MKNQTNHTLLSEAIRIGDELIKKAKRDIHGTYWNSISTDGHGKVAWASSEGLYGGVSGISWFLLTLYKQTNDQKYLEKGLEGLDWSLNYDRDNPSGFFALITGKMSLPLTLIYASEITGRQEYLKKAVQIALKAEVFLEQEQIIDDLINGISGTLLGLLHVYQKTGDNRLLPLINKFTQRLIDRAWWEKDGLYWDRNGQQIGGLCGFSHGVSGIGFVFMELSRMTGNKAFNDIARLAFKYEEQFFDAEKNNWVDLRNGVYTPEDAARHRAAFEANNKIFFSSPNQMNAWCHGAAGIGLARARAVELLEEESYQTDLENALRKCDLPPKNHSPEGSFTMCHGVLGNAEVFLEAFRVTKDVKFHEKAISAALRAIELKKEGNYYVSGYTDAQGKEDISLFMGNAGIGYFMLRCLDPLNTPSLLAPIVKGSREIPIKQLNTLCLSPLDLKRVLLSKFFERSLASAETLQLPVFKKILKSGLRKLNFSEIEEVNAEIKALEGAKADLLKDVWNLEFTIYRLDRNAESHSYLSTKSRVLMEDAGVFCEKNTTIPGDMEFVLDNDIQLYSSKWEWGKDDFKATEKNIQVPEATHFWLLRSTHLGVNSEPLSDFTCLTLEVFKNKITLGKGIEEMLEAFGEISDDEKDAVKHLVHEQIKQAYLSGILLGFPPPGRLK
jgi:rhamnogalacturonyl hydrolase YesR